MKKLSTKDILGIAIAAAATAAVVAGVVVVVKKCKKAIDAYEQEMLDAENAEAEEAVPDCVCGEPAPVCEDLSETPSCTDESQQAEEAIPQEEANEEEIPE